MYANDQATNGSGRKPSISPFLRQSIFTPQSILTLLRRKNYNISNLLLLPPVRFDFLAENTESVPSCFKFWDITPFSLNYTAYQYSNDRTFFGFKRHQLIWWRSRTLRYVKAYIIWLHRKFCCPNSQFKSSAVRKFHWFDGNYLNTWKIMIKSLTWELIGARSIIFQLRFNVIEDWRKKSNKGD